MNLTQFLSVVRARWWLGAIVMALVTGAGLGYSLTSPRIYTANASVMLDAVSPDITGNFGGGLLLPSYIATQVDLIASERVRLKAVELLGMEKDPAQRELWLGKTGGSGDFKVWLASGLYDDLEVKPSRESNLITVRYASSDAEHAARVTNAIVQAYTETAIELKSEPARQYVQVYQERAQKARQEFEAAQARLTEFQRSNGLLNGGVDGKVDLEAARLTELSSQLVQLQALASESQSRRSEVSGGAERLSEVRGDPAVAQLRIDLVREQGRLLELNQRLGDQHPQVTEQQARIEELRSRLNAAIRTASGSVVVGDNVNQRRLASLQATIATQREKVAQLRGVRDRADVMARDVETARQAYESVMQRLSQTELAGRSSQTSVAVVQSASAPLRPSAPRTTLNTIAALFAGLVLGLSTIIFAELRDRRVRTADEVIGELQQALLLELPKVQFSTTPSSGKRGRSPAGLVLQRDVEEV